jgi:hypothetical protein
MGEKTVRPMTNPKVKARIVNGRPDGSYQCTECKAFSFEHRPSCSQMRPFPIQNGGSIPWWLAEVAFEYYHENWRGQSLERLAERCGFGVAELVGFIRREL